MNAMNYELIIRTVFKCERTRRFGADADIYRGLERVSALLPGQESVEQFTLGVKVGEVAAYLRSALYEVQVQNQEKKEFISKINQCLDYLYKPSYENIGKCVEETVVAFTEIGLMVLE